LIEEVGLSKKINEKVRNLSGGMKRRLSIAIAAIGNPKVIFFDEPTTGLDPIKTKEILNLLKKLKKDKILILTTHSMEEADDLSDRIMILKNGKIITIGDSFSLKDDFSKRKHLNIIIKENFSQ